MMLSGTGAPASTLAPERPEIREGALGRDGERLDADAVLRASGQMHLAGRHEGRDPAMHAALDPAELILARRPVAEGRVAMAVDEAGRER